MSTRTSWLGVPLPICPTCGAKGKRCKRPSGHDAMEWHSARRKLAESERAAGDVLAAVDRVLNDDPTAPLARIAERQAELDAELYATVAELRAAGVSWARIGGALGVTKQAAVKRFGERRPAAVETGPTLLDALAEAPR